MRRAFEAAARISNIYGQMYANTGTATDSARVNRSARWTRLMAIHAGGCSPGDRW
jgi:hypothetical protein